jgi:uncharacterized protein YuzE
MNSLTVTYDTETNAICIRFSEEAIEETIVLSGSTYMDVRADGRPIGFEIIGTENDLIEDAWPDLSNILLHDLLRPSGI